MESAEKRNPLKAVLVVVLVVAAGAAIYYAQQQAAKPPAAPEVNVPTGDGVGTPPYIDKDLKSKGIPAPGEPKWNVVVELDKSKGRNSFHFTVTEEHGWAANGIYVELRHEGLPEKEGKGMIKDRRATILCDKAPLRFHQRLEHTATVQAHEFPELDDFGTSANWKATVTNASDLTAPKPG
jgi:hypothetical protein